MNPIQSHKNLKQAVVFFGLLLLIVFFVAEFIASHLLYRRAFPGVFALNQVFKEFSAVISQKAATHNSEESAFVTTSSSEANPFLDLYKDKLMTDGVFRIHPFINYTNFSVALKNRPRSDYFGFRNQTDPYFTSPSSKLRWVVVTGGSEASGYAHYETIAERLERILNEKTKGKFTYKVVNLAMSGYALQHEINAYVNLVYHLKPRYVVSHTGWNDVINASMISKNFKELGLNYIKFEEYWLSRLYELKVEKSFLNWVANDVGEELIVPTFFKNVEKYSNIVNSNHGKLIVGIQDYEASKFDRPHLSFYDRVEKRYAKLKMEAKKRGHLEMSEYGPYEFHDNIHTLDSAAEKMALIYANRILKMESSL